MAASSARHPLDYRDRAGGLDVIGGVHGCLVELRALFDALGYTRRADDSWLPLPGRIVVFVGDLADRGPDSLGVLETVIRMADAGHALCVPGNHDGQLQRVLEGEAIPAINGLDTTMAELEGAAPDVRKRILDFLQALPSHYVLDRGRLVVAHTGLEEALHGQESATIRRLAAYGLTEGDVDPTDVAKRHPWIPGYRGAAAVVYGHTVVSEPRWDRNTLDVDTGCVFGGRLSALRWPERAFVSVPARRAHAVMNGSRRRAREQRDSDAAIE